MVPSFNQTLRIQSDTVLFLNELIKSIETVKQHERTRWSQMGYFRELDNRLQQAENLLFALLTSSHTRGMIKEQDCKVDQRRLRTGSLTPSLYPACFPKEVLQMIMNYRPNTFMPSETTHRLCLYRYALVCRQWSLVARGLLWRHVRLYTKTELFLFKRAIDEMKTYSSSRPDEEWLIEDIQSIFIRPSLQFFTGIPVISLLESLIKCSKNLKSFDIRGLTNGMPLAVSYLQLILRGNPYLRRLVCAKVSLDTVMNPSGLPFKLDDFIVKHPIVHQPERWISAKCIALDTCNARQVTVYQTEQVKSIYCHRIDVYCLVPTYQHVTHLTLDTCGIDDSTLMHILPQLHRLTAVNLIGNPITDTSLDFIRQQQVNWTLFSMKHTYTCSGQAILGLIKKLSLQSLGIELLPYEYNHSELIRAISDYCPDLVTLEIYGIPILPSESEDMIESSSGCSLEMKDLHHLVASLPSLRWVYVPQLERWPTGLKSYHRFMTLCEIGHHRFSDEGYLDVLYLNPDQSSR